MNLAQLSIEKKTISWMFAIILALGGIVSFFQLGQLEFPEFTINKAKIITVYPGASPQQVEEEVSSKLEDAVQQLARLDHVTSINSAGLSEVTVELDDSIPSEQYSQHWDELRRKITDVQADLPSGARASIVLDDFGDVFGIYFSISGNGYSVADLNEYAKALRRELILIEGVKKVTLDGVQEEQIFIEISREKLANLAISQATIESILANQNTVSNAGELDVEGLSIRIHPTGEFLAVEELQHLVVSEPNSGHITYLGDIAKISRGYQKMPQKIYHSNGETALTMGISFKSGVNVVDVGKLISKRITELQSEQPVGIDISSIYNQADVVDKSISAFLVTLAQAVGIVFVVLLIFMGLKSGLLMGIILLVTILGTFILMAQQNINLQSISLGALIIALGMLVDNAIVVTEGMLVATRRGLSNLAAAKQVVTQNQWPLLGATVISITAFAPIGLSASATGEFAGSLFWVLLFALALSWLTAMTLTPLFFSLLFKETKLEEGDNNTKVTKATESTENTDIYQGVLFELYRSLLTLCLKYRAATMLVTLVILIAGALAFANVKKSFFPPSTTPLYLVDYWLPEGYNIKTTEKFARAIETDLLASNDIAQVTSIIGGGGLRFVLPYSPENTLSNYIQFIVSVKDSSMLAASQLQTARLIRHTYPEGELRVKPMPNGPSPNAAVEVRFYGKDVEQLRQLASKAADIIEQDSATDIVRTNLRNKVNIVRPQLQEDAARRAGISKSDLDQAIQTTFNGRKIGTYREGSTLLPIMLRAPNSESLNADSLHEVQVWSAEYNTYVPIAQIVSAFEVSNETSIITRRDRKRTISVLVEPLLFNGESADSILTRIKPMVEAIPLPEGYEMEWGGEYETSTKASSSLMSSLPMGMLCMFIITVLLFNNMRQPIIIWLTVPLALVGAATGLLIMGESLGFMAILGLLSLIGMLLKNGIVLVDQIRLYLAQDMDAYTAIFDASVSRVRPVMMAALTTMLGMMPLIFDAFFSAMAVTIIFGLGFASIVTLILLPVLYSIFYQITPLTHAEFNHE